MLGAVRPGGGVAAFEQVVIDLGDAPGAGLPGFSQHRLEVRSQVLLCLNGFRLYLVAQTTVDLGRRLGLHMSTFEINYDMIIQTGECWFYLKEVFS